MVKMRVLIVTGWEDWNNTQLSIEKNEEFLPSLLLPNLLASLPSLHNDKLHWKSGGNKSPSLVS